ncbi:unnamed protein product [Scytosiphon promiscuus]
MFDKNVFTWLVFRALKHPHAQPCRCFPSGASSKQPSLILLTSVQKCVFEVSSPCTFAIHALSYVLRVQCNANSKADLHLPLHSRRTSLFPRHPNVPARDPPDISIPMLATGACSGLPGPIRACRREISTANPSHSLETAF